MRVEQDRSRQDRHAILAAFRVANDDLAPLQYEILDAKSERLQYPLVEKKKAPEALDSG